MTQDPDNMDRRTNRKGMTIQYLSYKEPALKNPEDKILHVSPSALIAMWRYWFRLSRLSIMVIGSFASYTKTKSVESAV